MLLCSGRGANVEVTFAKIENEFRETFGYVRQDIAAIRKKNLSLNYTVALLICCACEMLAWHKNLEADEVFTSLLPDTEPYPVIGKTLFEALRNGLAHNFRPDTIIIGSHQWRFSFIPQQGPQVSVRKGEPNWLQLNVQDLEEQVKAKIKAYEEELQQSQSARLKFLEKSKKSMRTKFPGARIAEAWKSLLREKRP